MADTEMVVTRAEDAAAPVEILEVKWMRKIEEHPAWPVLSRLPMTLGVQIPLLRFKVRDLLELEAGRVLLSSWCQTTDVPLSVGRVRLGWSEFEVSGQQIGVRLTQLL